jgi:hypothetical protein
LRKEEEAFSTSLKVAATCLKTSLGALVDKNKYWKSFISMLWSIYNCHEMISVWHWSDNSKRNRSMRAIFDLGSAALFSQTTLFRKDIRKTIMDNIGKFPMDIC